MNRSSKCVSEFSTLATSSHGPPRPVPPPGLLSPTAKGSPAAEPDAAQAVAPTPDPPRPAHWDQMTKHQKSNGKRHYKPKVRKGGA